MKQGAVFLAVACWGASAAGAEPTAADVAFFEAKVRPLLAGRCYQCHSVQAKKQRGGLALDSRAGLLKGGDSGPAVVPGQPANSLLLRAVRQQDSALQMPPTGKLPAPEIAVLEEWIRRGAPFPGPETSRPVHGVTLAEGRKFWSFQPLHLLPLPATRDSTWARRRHDYFVLAELEKRGLSPSAPASRRTLVRRLTFDLIGLPPTPEEVEAFVADPAPDAYERLVERLLASPHHGEHWGRFWLDLARYCDVPEPWSETKGSPYLYRDWVIGALTADLPYDQFVQQQLAADLLPAANPQDRAALGFLGLSPTYWKELKLDPGVIRAVVAEEWEERIGAVTSTFLGLTVACARCHDHKFDPITQADYYALAGVFASTRLADRSTLPDAVARSVQQARAQIKQLEAQIVKVTKSKAAPDTTAVEEMRRELAALRQAHPLAEMPLVPGVEEASLHVLADGPHKTKLLYKAGEAQDVAMQVRGNPGTPGPVVPRRFLAVLSPGAPRPFTQGSGRLELARALVTEGGPLAARVMVNRVWQHHFGAGLVETSSDFGAQGQRPSHPQLLDDLAARFVASGWSLKWLHREIVLSATYRQAVTHDARKHALDPDNRWLWRAHRRRLEVEAWRDAMLAASGTLDRTIGGPPTDLNAATNRRRTVYGTVKRRELNDLLRLHDFPDPTAHSPGRLPTTTPLQLLFTLNGPLLQQQAVALARRLQVEVPQGDGARVRRAYLLLFGRPATDAQVRLALDFLADGPADTLWPQYAQALLASNEFLFLD
jgi:hypothetical protein